MTDPQNEEHVAMLLAEERCYSQVYSQPPPEDDRLYCPVVWDGWGCWNYTLAGSKSYQPCPTFKEGFDSSLFATRECKHDGTWWTIPGSNRTWSNYTTCINSGDLAKDKLLIYVFISGYGISIAALVISLVIFCSFRQLQCDRVTLHKHLFSSYILNGSAWILYYTLAAFNANIITSNPWWCQALHVITQYFVTCNFFWMFCEGLYLHTIIVSAFTTGKKLLFSCFAVGWAGPVLPVTIYSVIRGLSIDESSGCWLDYSLLQWIVFGPIVATIIMNLIFLCNIVRVLITKLRAVNSPDANQSRKAVRATLILIPLLGLQYILFPFEPDKGTIHSDIYLIASAIVTSYQGLFVALIFCFFNGEVISVLKRRWGQHRLMRSSSSISRRQSTMYTQTTVTEANPPKTKA